MEHSSSLKGRRSLVSETLPQLSRRAIRPSEVGQQNGIEHRGFAHELGHRERGAGVEGPRDSSSVKRMRNGHRDCPFNQGMPKKK